MFKCVKCVKTFNRKDSVTRHLLTHNNIRYPCKDCKLTFSFKANLTRHVKNKHGVQAEVLPVPLVEVFNSTPLTSNYEAQSTEYVDGDIEMTEVLDIIEDLGLQNDDYEGLGSDNDVSEIIESVNKRKNDSLDETIDNSSTIQLASNVYVPNIPAGSSKDVIHSSQTKRLKSTRMSQVNTSRITPTKTAFDGFCTEYFIKNLDSEILNSLYFLNISKIQIKEVLMKSLEYGSVKYNLKLESAYEIPKTDIIENRAFKTMSRTLLVENNIDEMLDEDFDIIISEECDYSGKGSGYSLKSIDGILLNVNKYNPLFGSSYIKLPDFIQNKGATINVMNIYDNKCFQYSILSKFIKCHPERLSEQYEILANKYNFSDLTFPVPLQDIKKFEKRNPTVSINVYGFKKGFKINKNKTKKNKSQGSKNEQIILTVKKVCERELEEHFDLLLFSDKSGNQHYCLIKDLSRLISSQVTNSGHTMIYCKFCFKNYYNNANGMNKLEAHKRLCFKNKPATPCMPKYGEKLKFENWGNSFRHPIAIYADFECILKPIIHDEDEEKNTKFIQDHIPMSFGYYIKTSSSVSSELLKKYKIPTSPVIYRGEKSDDRLAVAKKFISSIVSEAIKIEQLLKTNVNIRNIDYAHHNKIIASGLCPLCKSKFTNENNAVKDHDHLNGLYRDTICLNCNFKRRTPNYVPCYFHNLSNYDAHFIITQLGYDENSIFVIPTTEEKFIAFSKNISPKFSIRFLDTLRFMSSSLNTLANNLSRAGQSQFRETEKHFKHNDLKLVTRKGIYPYEYTDSWEVLDEVTLPPIEKFYSTLTGENITEKEYAHATEVWKRFNCKTIGEYSDLYLKIDILLLADIFENFRDLCLKTYELDPSFYYTCPGMSFDCMLKHTNVQIELLYDYDMLLFCEAGVRGGITQSIKRYVKANNKTIPDYDVNKPDTWITYLDATNLYGWAMSEHLPLNGFKWYTDDLSVSHVLDMLNQMSNDSPTGMFLEVDVLYPDYLHDAHGDFPYLPERGTPPGSKISKLMTTVQSKTQYIVHYRNLKQAIEAGLILKKVHRILSYNQSSWLASYIKLNTDKRKLATNNFEKDFYKLMNNSVFGKTMENVRNRMTLELVSSDVRYTKLVNKTNFKCTTIYNENLCAIHLNSEIHNFNKPIFIGLAVLEISKTLMYEFHYKVMKKLYDDRISLLYMDTDSLIYSILTTDFYADILSKQELLEQLDTSNFPPDHPCYRTERKKVPGTFTDETGGESIWELASLRAKAYGYSLVGKETIKAKGVSKAVVKNQMTLEDIKHCLFEGLGSTAYNEKYSAYREMISFRSFKHDVKTISTKKIALNRHDDKRFIMENRINTLPWGHYQIEKLLSEED